MAWKLPAPVVAVQQRRRRHPAMATKSGEPRPPRAPWYRPERQTPPRDPEERLAALRRSRARSRGLLGVVLVGGALWFGIAALIWWLIAGSW